MTDVASAPATADPAVLVDRAMRALDGNYDRRDDVIRAYPAIQAIISAPAEVRRQCILIAARQDQWSGTFLLRFIARKQVGLRLDDIEEIISQRSSRSSWADARRLAALAGQIEATWKSLSDEEKDACFPSSTGSPPRPPIRR